MADEEEARAGDGRYQPGHSGNPRGRPPGARNKNQGILSDLLREHLEESQTIELGKGRDKHTSLLKTKEIFIRAVLASSIKGNVAAQRLVFNYVDGLPWLHVALEGRLVDLHYDLPLSDEEQQAYYDTLQDFFPGGVEDLMKLAEGNNPFIMTQEELKEMDLREKETARLKVLRDAGVDIFDDKILRRGRSPAGDPPEDEPEAPDPGDGP